MSSHPILQAWEEMEKGFSSHPSLALDALCTVVRHEVPSETRSLKRKADELSKELTETREEVTRQRDLHEAYRSIARRHESRADNLDAARRESAQAAEYYERRTQELRREHSHYETCMDEAKFNLDDALFKMKLKGLDREQSEIYDKLVQAKDMLGYK